MIIINHVLTYIFSVLDFTLIGGGENFNKKNKKSRRLLSSKLSSLQLLLWTNKEVNTNFKVKTEKNLRKYWLTAI